MVLPSSLLMSRTVASTCHGIMVSLIYDNKSIEPGFSFRAIKPFGMHHYIPKRAFLSPTLLVLCKGKNYPLHKTWPKSPTWQLRPRDKVTWPIAEFRWNGHRGVKYLKRWLNKIGDSVNLILRSWVSMLHRNGSHYRGSRSPLPNPLTC